MSALQSVIKEQILKLEAVTKSDINTRYRYARLSHILYLVQNFFMRQPRRDKKEETGMHTIIEEQFALWS